MTRLSVIVPTAGRSPHLEACLRAIRADAGDDAELILAVAPEVPAEAAVEAAADLCDRVLEVPAGFALANNRAFAEARGVYLATVNDDALVEPGWSAALCGLLDRQLPVASVQGLVLRLGDPGLDGAGIGWNRWLQAVQLGHGEAAPKLRTPRPIFGVSATAAVYRRAALADLAQREGPVSTERPFGEGPFDPKLFAYYEDVDLALRLHAAGHQAWLVPAARVRHAGSLTGRRLPWGGRSLIHGNRHLVLARRLHMGGLLRAWPRALWRDVLDAGGHLRGGELAAAVGVVHGLLRALPRLPGRLLGLGGRLPVAELMRFPDSLEQVIGR